MCDSIKCGCPSGRTPRFLEPSILLLLRQKPSYGYELIMNLKKGTFLETNPDAGVVYKILRKLEVNGFIKSSWITKERGPAKRIYTITAKGKKLLDAWSKSIFKKRDILNRFLFHYKKIKQGR
jgi:poly-beta-hydroxybutyrate-responsive repressor